MDAKLSSGITASRRLSPIVTDPQSVSSSSSVSDISQRRNQVRQKSSANSGYGSPTSLRDFRSPDIGLLRGSTEPNRELTRDLDCPSMLRTVTAKTVLRGFGRVFRSQGIDSAYALSQECERLGYFISHSWSASWFAKYITLSFHFNFWIATAVSFTFIILFLVLGLLYIDHSIWDTVRESVNPSLIFVAIGFFTFLPTLFFGSELLSCFPFVNTNRTRCFLDKCCINQTDPVQKRRGIEALGVFLARSDVLLILWSPDYFLRLWCAYEVAVYMSLEEDPNHPRRVVMIPLELISFASLVFGLDLVIQIVSVNFFFQGSNGLPEWATQLTATAIATIFSCFAYFFSYRWQVDQAFLRKQLAEFSLSKVECSDPADRPLVLRDIAHRYSTLEKSISARSRSLSFIDDVGTTRETSREPSPIPSRTVSSVLPSLNSAGLKAFEEYVRTNLQTPIEKALGTHHCVLPYKFLLTMSLPAVWAAMGLMCHWILKAKGMGDTIDSLDTEAVIFLIFSKLLRAITFYPLLTASLLMYQDVTEPWIKKSEARQFFRGFVAIVLIGIYVYMFGFHYIFLREMDADVVFYTSLPQILLFLLIYTRLGVLATRLATRMKNKCKQSRENILRQKSPEREPTMADSDTVNSESPNFPPTAVITTV
jgi:hypothetical protein